MDLWHIPAIDAHAYKLPVPDWGADIDPSNGTKFAQPSILEPNFAQSSQNLSYHRSLRDLGELLDCDPTEKAIATQRDRLGFETIAQRCFDAANLKAVVLDDDRRLTAEQTLPIDWYQQWLAPYRVICLEHLAEHMISRVDRFDVFLEWFRSELDPLPPRVVGFKSIAACRSGLDIHLVYPDIAEECFYALKAQQVAHDRSNRSLRLQKELVDFLLLVAFDIAAHYHTPILFETGLGDTSVDLRLANPLHLRPILEEPLYQSVPIVLLHGAYPFTREAGYLSSLYPQVYVDTGIVIPGLSLRGMKSFIHHLLETAPICNIVYSSSGCWRIEQFYLGAKWSRIILGQVLEEVIQDGDLTAQEAETGAIAILHENAKRLYALSIE